MKGEFYRTPNGSNSNNEYLVNPTGANDNNNANNSNGVAPDYMNSLIQVSGYLPPKAVQPCRENSSCPVSYRRNSDADVSNPLWDVDAVNGIPFDYADLIEAVRECRQNVLWKDSVAGFVKNRLVNCEKIMKSLHDGSYKLSPYSCFRIYEPKQRDIVATAFRDRVVQRAMCDTYLYHALTKGFIYDNWACQVGKGTTKCRKRMRTLLQRHWKKHGNNGWVLNVDIMNYFGSTPHWVAKKAVAERVSNPWVRNYVFMIIDSFHGIAGDHRGIGLGSQISQLIQLAVLDRLDHYIKEKLHIKIYIRYMDDIKIVSESKEKLKECLKSISKYLEERELQISKKKTYIAPLSDGVKFLGFKYKLTDTGFVVMKLPSNKISKERRRIRRQMPHLPKERMDLAYQSWKANAKQGTTYAVLRRMDTYYYTARRKFYA